MIGKIKLLTAGVLASTGLLAVDELPGWSDLPALAKVSIIACLVVANVLVVMWLLLLIAKERKDNVNQIRSLIDAATAATERQRKDFASEVANSREHHASIVERVCEGFEKAAGVAHLDSQAVVAKLEQTRESNDKLREHCASVLSRHDAGEVRAEARETRAQDREDREAGRRRPLGTPGDAGQTAGHEPAGGPDAQGDAVGDDAA